MPQLQAGDADSDLEGDVASIPPTITRPVQHHLGRLLATAYARSGAVDADPFADLLARLDAALSAAREGREETFRADLLATAPSLHRFAMSLRRDPVDADDLVQDTMLRAWRARESFKPGTNLEAWLFTIMRNVFYSAHRRRSREVSDSEGTYAARLTTPAAQGGALDLQDVRQALDDLPAPMRQALMLVAVEDVSYEEAAAILRCRVGTVKSRVWRARDRLARLLGHEAAAFESDGLSLAVLDPAGRAAPAI